MMARDRRPNLTAKNLDRLSAFLNRETEWEEPERCEMQTVIPLKVENGWIAFEQVMLPKVWLDEPIEAIVKSFGILIKPKSLSQQMRGIVEQRLSDEELDELYSQR